MEQALAGRPHQVLFFPGGEPRKKMAEVEALAEQMVAGGGDRSSVVVAFGGGIVTDVAGFLAAVFMRGIPVIQIPTTLLAQVDAAVGGKTGVNLVSGKNLVGSFHQPLVVLIDPDVLQDAAGARVPRGPVRDHQVRRDSRRRVVPTCWPSGAERVFAQEPATVDRIIADAVRIKAEVVTADEREGDLRRILNFGHTVGHALEADTQYQRFLHGEAVAFGMHAATALAERVVELAPSEAARIHSVIRSYGPIPTLDGHLRVEPVCAAGGGQENRAGQSPLRAAGEDRRRESCYRRRRPRGHGRDRSGAEVMTPATGTTPKGIGSEEAASRWVRGMFGRVAARYDLLNHLLSFNLDKRWRARTVERVADVLARPDAKVLDLCCGTGDVLLSLGTRRRAGVTIFGSDFCHPMLIEARRKIAAHRLRSPLFEADALALPLASDSLDLITVAFGFRNLTNYRRWAGRARAGAEARRRAGDSGIFAAHQSAVRRTVRILFDARAAVGGRNDFRLA